MLDEPEISLSPNKQLELLAHIYDLSKSGEAQFIIATHSPLLLSIPSAQLIELSDSGIIEKPYEETSHGKLLNLFYQSPERFHRNLDQVT